MFIEHIDDSNDSLLSIEVILLDDTAPSGGGFVCCICNVSTFQILGYLTLNKS